jgi:hypothetical protein
MVIWYGTIKKDGLMKKAKNLIIGCEHDGSYIPVNEVLKLIKLAQINAIEETCRVCAESAELGSFEYMEDWMEEPFNITIDDYSNIRGIDKQSILSVADKLKKELE